MPDLGLFGWIFVGLVAGWLSGMVVPQHSARGCLPNILVGVLGGLLGGWLSERLGIGDARGLLGAIVVAFVGAVLVRFVLGTLEDGSRRQ